MKRVVLFIPFIATFAAIICSSMRDSGTRPMYTTDVAVSGGGRILFSNKGASGVTRYDASSEIL